jgi:hypothetical protein
MWKFGVLGKDFGYRKFSRYPEGKDVWRSTDPAHGEPGHPHFGDVAEVYNVIDARQSEPQETVKQAIRLLGYTDQAEHYTHFSYEMVALTPRCAMELGYEVSAEDQQRSYIEVSGRKGFGVKADDLIDKLNEIGNAHRFAEKSVHAHSLRLLLFVRHDVGYNDDNTRNDPSRDSTSVNKKKKKKMHKKNTEPHAIPCPLRPPPDFARLHALAMSCLHRSPSFTQA